MKLPQKAQTRCPRSHRSRVLVSEIQGLCHFESEDKFTWILTYFRLPQWVLSLSVPNSSHEGSPELLPGNAVGFIYQIQPCCESRLRVNTTHAFSKYCSYSQTRTKINLTLKGLHYHRPSIPGTPKNSPYPSLHLHTSQLGPTVYH